MHIGTMLKRQGQLSDFRTVDKIITDSFYGETAVTETEYSCYALVVPARAYDIHSNIYYRPEVTGNEFIGIINIYISPEDAVYISEEDVYVDGTKRYKIIASEHWDKTNSDYVLFEGHYENDTETTQTYEVSYVNPTTEISGYVEILSDATSVETFDTNVYNINIRAKTNSIFVELSSDGTTYGDKILLEAGEYFGDTITLSFSCKSVRFSNKDITKNGSYQVIGWSSA